MAPDRSTRRTFVRAAGLGVAALAGCIGGETPGSSTSETDTPGRGTRTPTQTTTATAAETTSERTVTEANPYAAHPWFEERGEVLDELTTIGERWTDQHGKATVAEDGFGAGGAVKLDTAGASRVRLVRRFDAPRDLRDRGFSLAAKLHATTKPLVQLSVVLEDAAGNRRYHSGSIQPHATGRWLRLDTGVARDDGLDPSAVAEIWIEQYVGGAESVLNVADLRAVPTPEAGAVVFSFSNEAPADYSVARDVLADYGYEGVCFPTLETIGRGVTPDASRFREMQAAGWDVGGHTLDHERLSDHSKPEQRRILETNARRLRDLGLADGQRHFRAPYANYDGNTLDVVLDSFDCCVSGAGSATGTLRAVTDPRMVGFRSGTDLDDVAKCVDAAATYGQLLGLTVPMEDVDRTHVETMVETVDRAVRRGDVEVRTLSELGLTARTG